MAIDNGAKRASVINYGLPFGRPLSPPDNTIDAGDRQALAFSYAALSGAAVVIPPFVRYRARLIEVVRYRARIS